MVAQFKSNVRRREEKGLGSVSMKRLIFCGVVAVPPFMLLRFTPLAPVAMPLLLANFIALLILTGERGGVPLWARLLANWRGALVLASARHPASLRAWLARALNLDAASARLQSAVLFPMSGATVDHHDRWSLYGSLHEAETSAGLHFVESVHG